jgi:hypothetical protein
VLYHIVRAAYGFLGGLKEDSHNVIKLILVRL